MQLSNEFDKDELAYWYAGYYACHWCGQSHADCFHHALGRETNHILSATPINNHDCHLPHHGLIRTDGNIRVLLQRNLRALIAKGYVITEEKDGAYLEKYKKYYL